MLDTDEEQYQLPPNTIWNHVSKIAISEDKINFKMPGGTGFKPHQDSQAGWEVYAKYFINVKRGL